MHSRSHLGLERCKPVPLESHVPQFSPRVLKVEFSLGNRFAFEDMSREMSLYGFGSANLHCVVSAQSLGGS